MFVGIGMNLVRGGTSASPASLFAASEPGVWYDPSQINTLYQDNTGTTPVTAPAQTVGLMLDKSKGLVLGSELRGSGAIGLVGTATAATYNTATGVGTVTRVDASNQSFVQWTGLTAAYSKITVSCTSGVGITVRAGTYTGSGTVVLSGQEFTLYSLSSGGAITITSSSATSGFTVTSIKEAPGNHATQATSAQRPTYGINPITGTRNLMTYTEAFTNATWLTQGGSWSAVDADGFQTFTEDTATSQHRLYDDPYSVVSGQTYTLSAQVAYSTRRWVFLAFYDGVTTVTAWFDLLNGVNGSVTAGATSTMTTISSGVYSITLTRTAGATSSAANVQIGPQSADGETIAWTGTGATTRVAKYQFELGSTATAYQKVVSQYEVTQAGVQSVSYLAFDGVDDGMVTGTITPATNKVQVFAGVRKLSDAARACIAELGSGGPLGSFSIFGPTSALSGYNFTSTGSSLASAAQIGGYSSPITSVVSGIGETATNTAILRVNSNQVASSATVQGSGNYNANILYIGRRGGTTLPFNGRIYSLITRFGANLTTGQITSTETWVNGETGAY
jgi:hypothetical protein